VIFKNFADQGWIGFNFIGSGLDWDWKISQSTHLCWAASVRTAECGVIVFANNQSHCFWVMANG